MSSYLFLCAGKTCAVPMQLPGIKAPQMPIQNFGSDMGADLAASVIAQGAAPADTVKAIH